MLVLAAALLCVLTKSTIFLAVPLVAVLGLVVILQARPGWGRWILGGLVLLLSIALAFAFQFSDAANWYRRSDHRRIGAPTRVLDPQAVEGSAVIQIERIPGSQTQPILFQPISPTTLAELRGEPVTLGAWVWASEPVEILSPEIWTEGKRFDKKIQVGTEPVFFTLSDRIPLKTQRLQIVLNPEFVPTDAPITIFYDGIIFTKGRFTARELSTDGVKPARLENMLQNPSGETPWLTIHPQVMGRVGELSRFSMYLIPALQDGPGAGYIFRNAGKNLFQSFWARFGWNQVQVPYPVYQVLLAATLIAGIGFAAWAWQNRALAGNPAAISAVWLIGLGAFLWLSAWLRVGIPFWSEQPFVPSARYAYPAIIPTSFLFAFGWKTLIGRFKGAGFLLYFGGLAWLNGIAWVSILQYYSQ
jgi:hypothetical protein